MIGQVTWNGSWIPSKELGMDPTYPHFDFGHKLESKVDETREGGAVVWWCVMVVVPPPLVPT